MRVAAAPANALGRPSLTLSEQRSALFLATDPIAVALGAGSEGQQQQLLLCPRGEYDRATDAFLRRPGRCVCVWRYVDVCGHDGRSLED